MTWPSLLGYQAEDLALYYQLDPNMELIDRHDVIRRNALAVEVTGPHRLFFLFFFFLFYIIFIIVVGCFMVLFVVCLLCNFLFCFDFYYF